MNKRQRGRWIFWGVVTAAVATLLVLAIIPEPLLVEAAEARRGPLTASITEEGRTRLRHRFEVVAPMQGQMDRVNLHVGDALDQGEVITRIHPAAAPLLDARSHAEARAAVDAATAAVAAAEERQRATGAELELALAEMERGERIFADGRISAAEMDRLRSAFRQAEARHRQARFETQVAQSQLESSRAVLARYDESETETEPVPVKAPIAGFVMRIDRESAGPIARGAPIIELGNTQDLEVAVDVLSSDAVRIPPGAEVLLHRWGGDEPLAARVQRIEPIGRTKVSALGVEEQRVWVICDFVDAPGERLGDGYRVEAEIILWQGEDVLQIPSSSLFRTEEGWAVFVIEAERAMVRQVETGHRAGLMTEIRTGLVEGEQVVASPDDRLEHGMRITF